MPTFRTSQPVSAANPSLPHIVLVGLPGSGKSTVGQLLAEKLERSFLDFDREISRREGMTIAEIFAQRGEPYFRKLEHDLTAELKELGNMVLSPGGGWVVAPETVALIRPPAKLVYLKVRPATALKRMALKRASRPLLQRPDPLSELERLLAARYRGYEAADFTVDVERLDQQGVVSQILKKLSSFSAG